MSPVNKVIISGNISGEPVLRHTASGKAVLNFTIGNDQVRRVGGQLDSKTNWFDCTLWADKAERGAEMLQKGSEVLVIGKLNERLYTDSQQRRRRQVEIVADDFTLIRQPARAQEQLTVSP